MKKVALSLLIILFVGMLFFCNITDMATDHHPPLNYETDYVVHLLPRFSWDGQKQNCEIVFYGAMNRPVLSVGTPNQRNKFWVHCWHYWSTGNDENLNIDW